MAGERTDVVDWALAERVATRVAGSDPLAASYHAQSLADDFAEATALAERLVTETTGLHPAGPARARVVDRQGWVRANTASFQRLLAPLLGTMAERLEGRRMWAPRAVTRTLTGSEVGVLLGWMSQRVLGQYDLLVLDDETATEQDLVYYVGPNVLSLERRFGFPPREFRLWLALHEVTHRAQFTGVPWLREHYLGLVATALSAADPDPSRLVSALRDVLRQDGARRSEALAQGGVLGLVATPEQREALAAIGGLMSLLEGHGDVTMNRAGRGHVPSADRFARVLSQRRAARSLPVRLLQKLTGIDAKLAQYEAGERFIAAIEAAAGEHAIDRCWEGPAQLPMLAEIREPQRWLERVGIAA
jgi:coenzyme F420 biosynthesis associated uncharacterized protein